VSRASSFLWLALLGACAASPKEEPERPDAIALGRETLVRARTAELVLSSRYREEAKLEAIHIEKPEPGIVTARGSSVFALRKLRVEAESIRVTWLEPEHENLLVYAKDVALFQQQRERPYYSKNLSAVSMANDKVSFFQQ
jgi:hypothetical protein